MMPNVNTARAEFKPGDWACERRLHDSEEGWGTVLRERICLKGRKSTVLVALLASVCARRYRLPSLTWEKGRL